jgi:hypothetical protein
VLGLVWSDRVVAKVNDRHYVSPLEADSVLDNEPIFFENRPTATRVATHVIVGRSATSRSIAIYVSETAEPGLWFVHTAHRSRRAHEILRQEGRIP